MNREKLVESLKKALRFVINEEPSTKRELARARELYPVLVRLGDEAIQDFAAEIEDQLDTQIAECAEEFAQEIHDALLLPSPECTNPKCVNKTVALDALLHPFPEEGLIDTLSPGDTIPLGLCPDCRMPVYQREEFPEDEPDYFAQALATTTGDENDSDRAMYLAQELAAQDSADSEDSTPVPSFDAPDSTGDVEPFYTK